MMEGWTAGGGGRDAQEQGLRLENGGGSEAWMLCRVIH